MIDDLLAANARFVATDPELPVDRFPTRHLTVLTCMDARVDPLRVLGLDLGEAKVIRNAGGRPTPETIDGLILTVEKLGVTKILVMHHTGCAAGVTPEDMAVDLDTIRAHPALSEVEVAGATYDVATGRITAA